MGGVLLLPLLWVLVMVLLVLVYVRRYNNQRQAGGGGRRGRERSGRSGTVPGRDQGGRGDIRGASETLQTIE
ncbi:hypothetical protein E2C01_009085 [Portunus trituberculatus]|uniref:Uncharacterized protein n=1 Tax=Portunus trituberculatus TaxID=210409 RepID=A0A5B7D565_PORTR|nr:hypothetical protein [Portunus trituberculatus]